MLTILSQSARRRERKMKPNEPWWVSTKEFLPNEGEKVLIITKFGTVQNSALRTYLPTGRQKNCPVLFSPDAYKPHEDAKWWMPIPEDGWNDVKNVPPGEGTMCLIMGMYGKVSSAIWKRPFGVYEPDFMPFPGFEALFWRDMPELPPGVKLHFR